jgi:hypothetical protein
MLVLLMAANRSERVIGAVVVVLVMILLIVLSVELLLFLVLSIVIDNVMSSEWTVVLLEDNERRANRSERELIDGVDGSNSDGATGVVDVLLVVRGVELMLVVRVEVLLVILLVILLIVLLMVLLDTSPAAEDTAEEEPCGEVWVEPRANPSKMGGCLSATGRGHIPRMELLSVVLMLMVVVFVLVGEGDGLVVVVEVLSGDGRVETVLEFGVGTAVRRIPRDTTVVQLVGIDGWC